MKMPTDPQTENRRHWVVTSHSPEDMAVIDEVNRGASERALGINRFSDERALRVRTIDAKAQITPAFRKRAVQ